jgi:hypothetical protein
LMISGIVRKSMWFSPLWCLGGTPPPAPRGASPWEPAANEPLGTFHVYHNPGAKKQTIL